MPSVIFMLGMSKNDIESIEREAGRALNHIPEFVVAEDGAFDDKKKEALYNAAGRIAASNATHAPVNIFVTAASTVSAEFIRAALNYAYAIFVYGFGQDTSICLIAAFDTGGKEKRGLEELFREVQLPRYNDRIDEYSGPGHGMQGSELQWNIRGAIVRRVVILPKDKLDAECIAKYCALLANPGAAIAPLPDLVNGCPPIFTVAGARLESHYEYIKAYARKAFFEHIGLLIKEGVNENKPMPVEKTTWAVEEIIKFAMERVKSALPQGYELIAYPVTAENFQFDNNDTLRTAEQKIFGNTLSDAFDKYYKDGEIDRILESIEPEIKLKTRSILYDALARSGGCGVDALKAALSNDRADIIRGVTQTMDEAQRTASKLKANEGVIRESGLESTHGCLFGRRSPLLQEVIHEIYSKYYSAKLERRDHEICVAICRRLLILLSTLPQQMLDADFGSSCCSYIDEFIQSDRSAKIQQDEKQQLWRAYERVDDEAFALDPGMKTNILGIYCDAMKNDEATQYEINVRELVDARIARNLAGIENLPVELQMRENYLIAAGEIDAHNAVYSMVRQRAGQQSPPFWIYQPVVHHAWEEFPHLNKLFLFVGDALAQQIQGAGIEVINTFNNKEIYALRVWADGRIESVIDSAVPGAAEN